MNCVASYLVSNLSLLPANVSKALQLLTEEVAAGELTKRGYLTRRAALLRPFPHLVTSNGSEQFGGHREGGGGRPPSEGGHMAGKDSKLV